MKFNQPLYYCTECKTLVSSLDKLLFVEDHSNKGFCSEACIEDFYRPIIRHYEEMEMELRSRLKLEDEMINTGLSNKELVEEVLEFPNEVWSVKNELDEEVSTYIRHFENFSAVVVCTVYKGDASFIFLSTETKSREFLAEIRKGNKNAEAEKFQNAELNEEGLNEDDFNFMQLLENKKSKLLADLLTKRLDSDIDFEDFTLYEYCFQECLNSPDEVFESKDNEGDLFFTYTKSYVKEDENFFYIISCLKRKDTEDAESISVFPVLAFPTRDMNLYADFRAGKKISGHISN